MLEEIAYALAGVYASDTFRFNLAARYLNLDKGRHVFNAFSGFVPGLCVGYAAEQVTGTSGFMELYCVVASSLNLLAEFPFERNSTSSESDGIYTKLHQDSPRED